jgi:hypothetical protein
MRKTNSIMFALTLVLIATATASAQDAGARAKDLLKQARAAIGGEGKLNSIHSLSVSGSYRRVVQDDAPQMDGDLEINFLLPDKYMKTETMRMPIGDGHVTRVEGINGDKVFRDAQSTGGGMVIIRRPDETPQAQTNQSRALRAEFARNLFGFLLVAQPSLPLELSYAGEAEAEDGRADVIEVKGPDEFALRLFLDKKSHLPLMITYRGARPRIAVMNRQMQAGSREEAEQKAKEAEKHMESAPPQMADFQVFFSDYRSVEGLMLPHVVSQSVDGKTNEEWELKKFKINPSLKAEEFQKK